MARVQAFTQLCSEAVEVDDAALLEQRDGAAGAGDSVRVGVLGAVQGHANWIVPVTARVLGHLLPQGGLEHRLGQPRQQPARVDG
jgi:hypothetical protein